MMAGFTKTKVYTLKVALNGDKRIWRRIAIRADQTLHDLHKTIYKAFDRYDQHLYSFYFARPGQPIGCGWRKLREAAEYTHPYNAAEPNPLTGRRLPSAAKKPIGALQLKTGHAFVYLFDFGDEWWHEISVETTDGQSDQRKYPQIIEKHGNSPPQYLDPEEGGE
jgi:hypothetical protein